MKRFIHIITLLAAVAFTLPTSAVTDKEMEEARTIATKTYLRYANNGSGYLDDLHPKTMAELEKSLKEKEKANIKAFKAIPVPTDYASWNKDKLVEYWSTTAFATNGLSDQGKAGKTRARKLLNAMTVSAPSAAPSQPTPAPETPAPATAQQPEATTPANPEATAPASPKADSVAAPDPELELAKIEQQVIAEAALEDEAGIRKADNHTWIYVVILILLVGVVVALVVFASNVMKKNGVRDDSAPVYPSDDAESARAIEKAERENGDLRAQIASRDAKLKALTRRLEEAEQANARLTEKVERLTAQLQQQKVVAPQPVRPTEPVAEAPRTVRPATQGTRTIYLGRANAKGIFVRADRVLNPEQSVFRLDTTDGFAGSFRVAPDPNVWNRALGNPMETLGGACVAPDLTATEGKERIVNESSGTAIFEGGCWKVIRKAKIHFE